MCGMCNAHVVGTFYSLPYTSHIVGTRPPYRKKSPHNINHYISEGRVRVRQIVVRVRVSLQ